MTAYCLFANVEGLAPDGLAEYVVQAHRTVERYGGGYLAVGGEVRPGKVHPCAPIRC